MGSIAYSHMAERFIEQLLYSYINCTDIAQVLTYASTVNTLGVIDINFLLQGAIS
jgi:hypothetical protein